MKITHSILLSLYMREKCVLSLTLPSTDLSGFNLNTKCIRVPKDQKNVMLLLRFTLVPEIIHKGDTSELCKTKKCQCYQI